MNSAHDVISEVYGKLLQTKLLIPFLGISVIGLPYLLWKNLSRQVYLIDFMIYEGNEKFSVTRESFMMYMRGVRSYTQESIDFQQRIILNSGLGNSTNYPPALTSLPSTESLETARDEFGFTVVSTIEALFKSTGISPKDIDIMVLNCSLFSPTPSLSELVINHFKMRSDVINYNLAGMGCSAGVISLNLAKDLMLVHKNSLCLVISTENVTQNWYRGNDKVTPIFRIGSKRMLLIIAFFPINLVRVCFYLIVCSVWEVLQYYFRTSLSIVSELNTDWITLFVLIL